MATLQLRCPDIECDGCANAIKRALGGMDGVQNVEVSVENTSVTVQFDAAQTNDAALRERLTRAGFPPQ
jgi:copper chaperone CopZ